MCSGGQQQWRPLAHAQWILGWVRLATIRPSAAIPRSGDFQPYARTYANGEVYHYHRGKGFLIKVPVRCRVLHARGHDFLRLGMPAVEPPCD
jgi:hypothetical protein